MDLKEDSSGVLYLSGYTESAGLPSTSDALQADYDGSVDAFGLKLDPSKAGAAGIDYFTYLGSDGLQVAYARGFRQQWQHVSGGLLELEHPFPRGRARACHHRRELGRLCDRLQPGIFHARRGHFRDSGNRASDTPALADVAAPPVIFVAHNAT